MGPHSEVLAAAAVISNGDSHVSMFGLLARLLISLFVVLMVLWVLAQVVRRKGLPGSRSGNARSRRPIDVLSRQSVGKGQTLMTVRLDDRVLLLGVTPQNITTLSELDPALFGIGEVLDVEALATGDEPVALNPAVDEEVMAVPNSAASFKAPSSSHSSTNSAGRLSSRLSSPASISWNERLDRLRARTVRR
jgi:flagellar protein FliO/FliZ